MKKKILIFGLAMGVAFLANAQIVNKLQSAAKTATTVASAAGYDVNTLKTSITSKLASKLNLTSDQQPKVAGYITQFLTAKSNIASLATTNKTSYKTKLKGLKSTLTSNMVSRFSPSA